MDQVWRGSIVEEANLQVHVSNLRKAIAGGGEDESLIVTAVRLHVVPD